MYQFLRYDWPLPNNCPVSSVIASSSESVSIGQHTNNVYVVIPPLSVPVSYRIVLLTYRIYHRTNRYFWDLGVRVRPVQPTSR
jgi:hypothetical protein